jgi:hypothetical protein
VLKALVKVSLCLKLQPINGASDVKQATNLLKTPRRYNSQHIILYENPMNTLHKHKIYMHATSSFNFLPPYQHGFL